MLTKCSCSFKSNRLIINASQLLLNVDGVSKRLFSCIWNSVTWLKSRLQLHRAPWQIQSHLEIQLSGYRALGDQCGRVVYITPSRVVEMHSSLDEAAGVSAVLLFAWPLGIEPVNKGEYPAISQEALPFGIGSQESRQDL